MNTETTIVAVDGEFAKITARHRGLPHFPMREYVEEQRARPGHEVLEILITGVQFPVDCGDANSAGEAAIAFRRRREALEAAGARVLVSPAKKTCGGVLKHSDDATLMITALSFCLRLQARWLFLVAADGDFAPLVWNLREFGIRTEVFASSESLAPELKRAACRVTALDGWLEAAAARRAGKAGAADQIVAFPSAARPVSQAN